MQPQQQTQSGGGGVGGQSGGSGNFLISPITGEKIPAEKMQEHMRYGKSSSLYKRFCTLGLRLFVGTNLSGFWK